MPLRPRKLWFLCLLLLAAPGTVVGQTPETADGEPWLPVPFRLRDLTWPTVLALGFMPRPAEPFAGGTWALELNISASNNFQASSDIQAYLEARGGARRPLSLADADLIRSTFAADQYYIDGEFTVVDLTLHYGLSERLAASLRLSHLSYGGGFLDSTIYAFHDTIGIGQSGRELVADNQFQMLFSSTDGSLFMAQRPTSGGFTDPLLALAYNLADPWHGWQFSFEGALKLPVADAERFLSTGSVDAGVQLSAQRKWRKSALVLNLAYVAPGEFEALEDFDPPHLPSLNVAYLHRLGRRTTAVVQMLFSKHIAREITDSDLSLREFQLSAGVQIEALAGLIGVGFTENLFNFDNTPDFGVHLSYGALLNRRLSDR